MILIFAFFALFLLIWIVLIPIGPIVQRLLAWAGNRTAAFRHRDYLPVVLVLVVGLAMTAWLAEEFLDVAVALQRESPKLTRIDTETHFWARELRTPGANLFLIAMTQLGSPPGLAIIVIAVCGVLIRQGRRRWAAYLILTSVSGGALVLALKMYFARARPDLAEALRKAVGYSFPSGHAMGTTVVFGALSYLALRMTRPWKQKAGVIAAFYTVIAAVSFSRVYIGVHWMSDIAAGIAAGTVWVGITTVAYEAFRRIRLVRARRRAVTSEVAASSA